MLRSCALPIALVLVLGSAAGARAFTVEFAGFEPSGDQWVGCDLQVEGSTNLVVVDPPAAAGLAVLGGPSDLLIDGNETVLFEFLAGPATDVRYTVSAIAVSGGATLQAYDAELDLIGSVEVSGTGEKDVSALFGGVPLGAFRVTNAVGGHRIGSVTFVPPDGVVTIDLREAPDEQQESLQHCGIGFAASGLIYVSPVTGLGVGGGTGSLDHFLEPGESLTVELPEPAFALGFTPMSSGPGIPHVLLTAFGTTGAVYGQLEIDAGGRIDVSELFGGATLSGFDVEVLEGDLALTELVIVPEPGAGTAGLGALAGLAALRARRGRCIE